MLLSSVILEPSPYTMSCPMPWTLIPGSAQIKYTLVLHICACYREKDGEKALLSHPLRLQNEAAFWTIPLIEPYVQFNSNEFYLYSVFKRGHSHKAALQTYYICSGGIGGKSRSKE